MDLVFGMIVPFFAVYNRFGTWTRKTGKIVPNFRFGWGLGC
ncbi:hypothetical protein FM102_08755 [Corynebacterium glutamicum]|nr:hypothetical protein FM102_08755 [Corynebacterium glutamicum]